MLDLINSIPLFGGFLTVVIAFIVVLSVIIFIHEYGHYIVGRWCGIHAEVFSMGFGPILKAWTDKRGTRWQIAAIPFGGYVRFLGDADASSKSDPAAIAAMDDDLRAKSFHGAPLYKKALTVAAGPMANFILSSLIFMGVILTSGIATERPTIGALKPLPADTTGLEVGDVITKINGTSVASYQDLLSYARAAVSPGLVQDYLVERNGNLVETTGPFPLLPLVNSVQPQSAAMAAGIEIGDLILSVDGKKLATFSDLQAVVHTSQGREMTLDIWRDGEILPIKLSAKLVDVPDGEGGFTQRTLIGITGGLFYEPLTRAPGFFEVAGLGVSQTGAIITGSLNGLYHMVSGAISTCNMQGFVGIAKTSGDAAQQGIESFVWFIAVLSTAIGMLNLFPIPVLDGGHLVFFAYEAITGKPPNERALDIMMRIGLFFILSLMAFALLNDFIC